VSTLIQKTYIVGRICGHLQEWAPKLLELARRGRLPNDALPRIPEEDILAWCGWHGLLVSSR
jgi:hypothetical protein